MKQAKIEALKLGEMFQDKSWYHSTGVSVEDNGEISLVVYLKEEPEFPYIIPLVYNSIQVRTVILGEVVLAE